MQTLTLLVNCIAEALECYENLKIELVRNCIVRSFIYNLQVVNFSAFILKYQ